MTNKEIAQSIYEKHLSLASTDGRLFRKTVMDEIMAACGCTLAASATFYNNAKKASAPVVGLGRAVTNSARKVVKGKADEQLQDEDQCFSVIELLKHNDGVTVGRCRAHLLQGDASEEFDDRVKFKPESTWVLIRGLGPNHGDTFKLSATEEEIKRYSPATEVIVAKVSIHDDVTVGVAEPEEAY